MRTAISRLTFGFADGDGCANSDCSGSTIYPKLVYIPAGTYLISQPLQISMYTQIVGDPTSPPTIKPCSDFGANYVLDGFPNTDGAYWNGGNAPLNFYKSIRNLNVDTTNVDPSVNVKCLNWAVSQATSIRYMTFTMAKNGFHQGIDMQGSANASAKDNSGGSGTMFGDLTFVNGNVGLTVSNQQFHFR
jgi:glucan 1,3-beta-glucosidase